MITQLKKHGPVFWQELDGLMIPLDLHDKDIDVDHVALDRVARSLSTSRQCTLTLELIQDLEWHNWNLVWPYLERSLSGRKQRTQMILDNEWWPFWDHMFCKFKK